ncbi:MAG: WYL domain-containing transcriptional regulator [Lachnospiraceae bacterium]|nr:WYL domain-containing transcriptional regulator [Lachnospiraceae bacterium]
MPKSEKQKLKLLYILQYLSAYSDKNHPLSTMRILDLLAEEGIQAERKSIYRDIASLQEYGYDIQSRKSKTDSGYYLASREFELPELKLLVDAVQASKFITLRKSRELIEKLEHFASEGDAKQLKRQVYVANRIKTANESIYDNVDVIHRAMQENVQISFLYYEWNLEGSLTARKDGARYQVSPWALLWSEENYYLVAYDETMEMIKHYRVDKMGRIALQKKDRLGSEQFDSFDIASYANKTFGMYGGTEEMVSLVFQHSLLGVCMDRFGKDTTLRKLDDEHFSVRVKVAVSSQFFGWLSGLGKGVTIKAPESVAVQYREYLQDILKNY